MKAHEEAVFKVRSGLMHYAQGYIHDKNRWFYFNESYCTFDGVSFYQFQLTRTGRNLVNLPKSRTAGWLESDMRYKS